MENTIRCCGEIISIDDSRAPTEQIEVSNSLNKEDHPSDIHEVISSDSNEPLGYEKKVIDLKDNASIMKAIKDYLSKKHQSNKESTEKEGTEKTENGKKRIETINVADDEELMNAVKDLVGGEIDGQIEIQVVHEDMEIPEDQLDQNEGN